MFLQLLQKTHQGRQGPHPIGLHSAWAFGRTKRRHN